MNEKTLQDINYRIDQLLEYGRNVLEDEQLIDRVENIRMHLEHYISENPIKSICIGCAGGYLIGRIFRTDD